jgi:hypothetical protein
MWLGYPSLFSARLSRPHKPANAMARPLLRPTDASPASDRRQSSSKDRRQHPIKEPRARRPPIPTATIPIAATSRPPTGFVQSGFNEVAVGPASRRALATSQKPPDSLVKKQRPWPQHVISRVHDNRGAMRTQQERGLLAILTDRLLEDMMHWARRRSGGSASERQGAEISAS